MGADLQSEFSTFSNKADCTDCSSNPNKAD